MEKQVLANKSDAFFEKGVLRALKTQHRGAGGIPEVVVVTTRAGVIGRATGACSRCHGIWCLSLLLGRVAYE
jgi:hypothetical protein